MRRLLILVALWSIAAPAMLAAQEHPVSSASVAAHPADPHPILSKDTTWAGVMVIVIIAMFVAATAVGLVVRFNAPQEVPPTHSHDEPPGASGHHGTSGTIDHHTHQH